MRRAACAIRTLSRLTASGAGKVNVWADCYLAAHYGLDAAFGDRTSAGREAS